MRASTKLKAAGLALIAVFATSAMIASAAQANPNPLYWTCEKYPCVITGDAGEYSHKFKVGGKEISCKTTAFDATVPDAEHNSVITVTPTYSGCTAKPGEIPITFTMNGCDFDLHGGETTAGKPHHFEGGTTDITCPLGKTIEVHIYASAVKHAAKESQCTWTIHEQTAGGKGNTFTNTTETPWDADLVTEATYKVTVHPPGLICGATEQTATYTGNTTLTAYEDLGNHTIEHPGGEKTTVYTEGSRIGLTISDG